MQKFDPTKQLSDLRLKAKLLVKHIYADQEIYLDELRKCLQYSVKHAVFQIITDGNQNRLNKISLTSRENFQKKIDTLVSNCSSFLTIEHLMDLALQMEKEREIKKEQSKKELLSEVESMHPPTIEPEGSISLALKNPLEGNYYFGEIMNTLENDTFSGERDIHTDYEYSNIDNSLSEDQAHRKINDHKNVDDPNLSGSLVEGDSIKEQERFQGFDFLKSLINIAGTKISFSSSINQHQNSKPVNMPVQIDLMNEDKQTLLPEDPIEIARWFESLDHALTRRLRNLSHSINVELLRVGIVNTLLPVPLLDAAIQGQLDFQHSSSNVLKFSVPVQYPIHDQEGVDFLCILLRSSEIEFDLPRLRKCRAKLNQHYKNLLIMSKQQRHWENRLLSQEAYQQWWGNSPTKK